MNEEITFEQLREMVREDADLTVIRITLIGEEDELPEQGEE